MAKRYRGFISYSRQDRALAMRLQKTLERYRLPVGFIAEVDDSRRLGRFCRDEADMSASSHLGQSIRDSIDDSDSLIVVGSPRAAKSVWVEAEVRYFLETRAGRKLFAFIVEGMPNSADVTTECFPPALRSAPATPQSILLSGGPLGIDVRSDGWPAGCVRLIAGLLDVNSDDLWQRTRRHLRRQWTAAAASVVVLVIGIAVLTTIALENRAASAVTRAELFAREAAAASESGDHLKAMRLGVAAYRTSQRSAVLPFQEARELPQVVSSLEHAYTHNLTQRVLTYPAAVEQVALSEDGNWVAAVVGTRVEVWEVDKLQLIASFDKYKTRVTSVAFSPDGKRLAVADVGSISLVRLDDLSAEPSAIAFGKHDALTDINANPTTVQFSAHGDYLLAFADQDLSLWRIEAGLPLHATFRAPLNIHSVVLTDDAGIALLRLSGGDATIWRVGTSEMGSGVTGKAKSSLGAAALSIDGHSLTSDGASVHYWKLNEESPQASVDTRSGTISVLAFSPDGQRFVTGSIDGIVQFWAPGMSIPLASFIGHSSRVSSLAVSRGAERVVSASADGTVRLWQTSLSKPSQSLDTGDVRVLSVAFSSDGSRMLAGTFKGRAHVWSTVDGKPLATVGLAAVDNELPDLTGMPEEMMDLTLAEALDLGRRQMSDPKFSGQFAAMLKGLPPTMTLRQLVAMAKSIPLEKELPPMAEVAFAPNGQSFITGSWDGNARLWAAEGGEAQKTFPMPGGLFTSVSFTPDGKAFLATSTSTGTQAVARLRNLEGAEVAAFSGHEKSITSAAISPDGRWVVTGSADRSARLWRIDGGDSVQTFSGQRGTIDDVAFSPDGKQLLTASEDGSVWLWQIGQSAPAQVWQASERQLKSVAFLPSGELFLTAALKGETKIWRVGAPAPVQSFDHRSAIYQAVVSPDGKSVLTGGADGIAKRWLVDDIVFQPLAEKVRLVCQRLTAVGAAEFTQADQQRYAMLEGVRSNPCTE